MKTTKEQNRYQYLKQREYQIEYHQKKREERKLLIETIESFNERREIIRNGRIN